MSVAMLTMQRIRVRIRSWKDVVLIVVMGVLVFGLQMLLQKVFGWEEKKAQTVSTIAAVILVFIWVIFVSGD